MPQKYYINTNSSINHPMRRCSQVLFVVSWVLICNVTILFASMTILKLNKIAVLQQKLAVIQKMPENTIKCMQDCADKVREFDGMCCDNLLNRCMRKGACKQERVSELTEQIESLNQIFYYYTTSTLVFFGVTMLLACIFCKILKQRRQASELLDNRARQNSTSVSGYNSGDSRTTLNEFLLTQKDEVCSICLQSFGEEKVVQLKCRHPFHRSCIQQWIHLKNNCPTCRRRHS